MVKNVPQVISNHELCVCSFMANWKSNCTLSPLRRKVSTMATTYLHLIKSIWTLRPGALQAGFYQFILFILFCVSSGNQKRETNCLGFAWDWNSVRSWLHIWHKSMRNEGAALCWLAKCNQPWNEEVHLSSGAGKPNLCKPGASNQSSYLKFRSRFGFGFGSKCVFDCGKLWFP